MLSSLFFMNSHGEVIIEMQFREKIPRSTIEAYWSTYVTPLRFLEEAPAVITYSNIVFSHILRNGVVLLAAVCEEGSALLSLEVLDMLCRVLTTYLREFSEDTLRENFSIVYQLLQEILDYGYPLITEVFALEELVPRPTLESKVRSMLDTPMIGRAGNVGVGARQALGYRNVVPWRDPGTQHTSNEILFDVVESMDYIMDSDGRVHKASVRGAVEVNCRLSGMPDVIMQLVNTDAFDDVGFHRCVRLHRYVGESAISFVPPDGKFTLMEYMCPPQLAPTAPPPLYVTPQVSFNHLGGRFNCMVGIRASGQSPFSLREPEKEVQRVVVRLMLPPHTASMTVSNCTAGSTTFERSRGMLTWTIGNLGRNSASLGGEFVFDPSASASAQAQAAASAGAEGGGSPAKASKSKHRGKAPVAAHAGLPSSGAGATAIVSFYVPNHSVSGLRVDSVQVQNEIGKPYKGVKYSAQSGNFVVRTV